MYRPLCVSTSRAKAGVRANATRAHVHTRRIGAFAHRVDVLCAPWTEGEGERERVDGTERGLSDGRYLTEDQHRIGFRRWLGTSCEHLAPFDSTKIFLFTHLYAN